MDWLLEHIDVVLPVALVLLFLFQRMFVRDGGEGPNLPDDSETESEARRIQEEIRRKIIARQHGREPGEGEQTQPVAFEEQPSHQRPVAFPRRQDQPPPLVSQRPRAAEAQPRRVEQAASTGRDFQNELRLQRERLRESREAKDEAMRRTQARGAPRAKRAVASRYRAGDLRDQLLGDLSTSENMKRAFILKEVVDRPIGLRDRPDVFSNWS